MKIILAVDGTTFSDAAIETLTKFNFSDADELKIVTVVDLAVPMSIDLYGGYLPASVEIENTAKENAGRILEQTKLNIQKLLKGNDFNISTDVLIGSPEGRIVEAAEEINADLIVVGSHGYNRWERLLLGSVSDSIVHHAPCSVLVVRSKA